MMRRARNAPISLAPGERDHLERLLRASTLRRRDFTRLTIVLMLADGATPAQMADILQLDRTTIHRYRVLFEKERLTGLLRPPPQRAARKYGPEVAQKILDVIAAPPPDQRICWTAKLVADRLDGVHYQYVWNFVRRRRIDLCSGRRRRRSRVR